MSDRGNKILHEALSLPPAERAELVDLVLASLDDADRREIDQAWAVEAESRIDAYERGEITAIDGEEVLARLRRRRNG